MEEKYSRVNVQFWNSEISKFWIFYSKPAARVKFLMPVSYGFLRYPLIVFGDISTGWNTSESCRKLFQLEWWLFFFTVSSALEQKCDFPCRFSKAAPSQRNQKFPRQHLMPKKPRPGRSEVSVDLITEAVYLRSKERSGWLVWSWNEHREMKSTNLLFWVTWLDLWFYIGCFCLQKTGGISTIAWWLEHNSFVRR